jgi:outer membrane protein OmpA-like peptidoglycan-associated protein
MSLNIVESIVGQLSTDQVEKICRATGQDPARARGTISTSVMAIVGHLVGRASTTTGANNLLTTLKSSPSPTSNLAAGLVGDGRDDLTDSVARSSGIQRPAADGLVSLLLPLVAGDLRREVMTGHLDAKDLANMLRSVRGGTPDLGVLADKREVPIPRHDETPGGGSRGSAAGGTRDVRDVDAREVRPIDVREGRPDIHEVKEVTPAPVRAAAPIDPTRRSEPPRRSMRWLPIALVLLGLLGLMLWGRARHEPTTGVDQNTSTTLTGAEVAKGHDLASGFAAKDVPDIIPLSDVHFATASTRLTAGADTVDQLAVLMKQHPGTRVRLEGHADNTGELKANEVLSADRAKAIKQMLTERGIEPSRIEATGKLDAKPAAGNETDQGRAINRRVDVVITGR